MILQTLLGLQPLAPLETLAIDPLLPEWIPEITLHRLRIGGATVSLRFQRNNNGHTTTEVLKQKGTLHIVKQASPNSLRTSLWQRLVDLFDVPAKV